MKRVVSMFVAGVVVAGSASPAFADDRPAAGASTEARAQAGVTQLPAAMSGGGPSGKALMWTGAGAFASGMGIALYGFLNNQNGEFPEFGEATATDKKLGGAGLAVAFAGGAMMAIGHKISKQAPDIQVGVGRFSVIKRFSW